MVKFIILTLVIFVFNICVMGQGKIEFINDNIKREKLSAKQVKLLIHDNKGTLDSVFTDKYLNKTYVLADKRVIVFFDTHGYLYKSMEELQTWIDILNAKKASNKPLHILKGKLLCGDNFETHVNEFIDTLMDLLSIKEKKISLSQLKEIDKLIERDSERLLRNKFFFSGMVAYVGEIFKQELPEASWDLVNLSSDSEIWQPYILSRNKKYNPFFLVYKELYEELAETNKIEIYETVLIELNK